MTRVECPLGASPRTRGFPRSSHHSCLFARGTGQETSKLLVSSMHLGWVLGSSAREPTPHQCSAVGGSHKRKALSSRRNCWYPTHSQSTTTATRTRTVCMASESLQNSTAKYNEALKLYSESPFEYNHDAGLCKSPAPVHLERCGELSLF